MTFEVRENYNPYRSKDYEDYYTLTGNQRERTITIRHFQGKERVGKYRTFPLSKEDYEHFWRLTKNDISSFLHNSSDYYAVK